MKIIFYLFILCIFSFAQNINLSSKDQDIYKSITPSYELDYDNKIKEEPYMPNSSLALNTSNYKDSYYVGEVFYIELIVKTNVDTNFDFIIKPILNNDLLFLNKNIKWKFINGEYKTNLYFQAKTSNAVLEKIDVKLSRNKNIFQEASIKINPIKFTKIDYDKNYSHIIASDLIVKKVKSSNFDDKNIIMMMELQANNTNLNSFFIKDIKKQGVENIKGDFNKSNAYYYAILPKYTKNFTFSYFNTNTKELKNIKIDIEINEESISTQSDLNPTNKDYNFYKLAILWLLSFILALIFVFYKNYFLLVISIIFFVLGFFIDTSTHIATLKPNSKVKILPTTQSIYFYTSKDYEEVEILNKRKNYIKILLKNRKIGWVDSANLQKN